MRKGMLSLFGFLAILTSTAFAQTPYNSSFTLVSPDFRNQATLPTNFTCKGKDISPELNWTNPPPKTASFALILSDPDAPGGVFYHWVVYNIPNTSTGFAQGISNLPMGATAGRNSWNTEQYKGACPPRGESHLYVFTAYALDTKLDLPMDADANAVIKAMQGHILAKSDLTAKFE